MREMCKRLILRLGGEAEGLFVAADEETKAGSSRTWGDVRSGSFKDALRGSEIGTDL
jgi:hypothetical protein